jgi:serine/threonine-protein kinase RsbW
METMTQRPGSAIGGNGEPLHEIDFHHDDMAMRMNVTLPATVEAVDATVARIMEVVKQIECATGKELEIELALREALANAITHGAQGDASKKVQCCVACEETQGMLIIVRDPGQGFDPLDIPDPTVGDNLYSNHGRGIFLINQLMDEVKFHKNGTEIHMRKF